MKHVFAFGLLVATSLASPSAAKVLQFSFDVRVDQANALVGVGTYGTGRFSYDDAALPVSSFPDSGGSVAVFDDPSIEIFFSILGETYSGSALAVVFDNVGIDDPFDSLYLLHQGEHLLALSFFDPTILSFDGIGLPITFPALAQGPFPDPSDDDDLTVPSGEFSFFDQKLGSGFNATILNISPVVTTSVPEPAGLGILAIGLLGLAGLRLRRP